MTTDVFCPPDLADRPLRVELDQTLRAAPELVFWAWTEQLDRWLAAPGTLLMPGEANTAFYFETREGGGRQPYYGRFLRVEQPALVEMTWLSPGTEGRETLLTIAIAPEGDGTRVRLTHAGFPSEALRAAHETTWPTYLAKLDAEMAG